MNQTLQYILNIIQQSEHLNDEEKNALLKAVKDTDKEIAITEFKLDRTEKVKRTTAILLEETIAELEQKRKAVEEQNKELEIESALERVRTVAMSMSKPDDLLSICEIQFNELKQLGFEEIRNALIGIFHDDKNYFNDYDYSDFSGGSITNIPYYKNSVIDKSLKQMKSATDAFTEFTVEGDDLEEWKNFRIQNGEYNDTRLKNVTVLYYYFYSISSGSIGISTFKKISEEQLSILKRFRNVFDLAYKRYIDITNAEAQAKESQIQLALERVRARTMAMHTSDELGETAALLFEQIKHLGIETYASGFNIWDRKHENLVSWMSNPTGSINPPFEMPIHSYIQHEKIFKAWKKHETFFEDDIAGKNLVKHYEFLRSFPLLDAAFKKSEVAGIKTPDRQVHNNAFFSEGYLLFITLEPCPQYRDIFIRFAKVFEQTYTRFLDLQKAEAQARESQIQLALERARAQSMIMQHSTELDNTLRVFHEQVLQLGIPSAFSFLWLPDEEKDRHIFWAAWAENNSTVFKSKAINYPMDRNEPATAQCLVDWKSSQPVVSYHVPPAGVENYFAAWSELIAGVEELKPGNFSDGVYYIEAFMKYGCFGVMVRNELPDKEKKILNRFAIEFERAYTRFLDLQKAEAQARESQIQLALERVRARTMAMQKSEELKNAATLLFQQAKALGVPAYSCGYNIWEKDEKEFTSWMSTQDGNDINAVPGIPLTEDANFIRFDESRKKGEPFFVLELRGERMQEHYQYLKTIPLFKAYFDYAVSVGYDLPKTQIHHIANFSQGNLLFITLEPCPEFHDVFKRFAAVFEQTYTRFLDLQKAESQARESQIQLALERVRARTMAMQKSDELSETVYILFQQFRELGENPDQATIGVINEDEKIIEYWVTMYGKPINKVFKFPIDEPNVTNKIYRAWKENKISLVIDLSGKELYEFAHYRESMGGAKYNPNEKRRVLNVAFFSKGLLNVQSNEQRSEESISLLEKFASVFEQTYTRFLDLQKAEAQAREAQIEASLERVRSRTMAMQKSEDLNQAASDMFQQIQSLGIQPWACGFNIFDTNEKAVTQYMSLADGGISPPFRTPLTEDPFFINIYDARQRREEFLVMESEGDSLAETYRYMFALPGSREIFGDLKNSGFEMPKFQITHCAYFSQGYLVFITYKPVPEAHDIFKRFSKVFEQTYTRFLDLQKAEVQAREAQIEAALEKVRSRTLAMQRSDELAETSAVLFQQLILLGIEPNRLYISIVKDEKGDSEFWITDEDGSKVSMAYEDNLLNNPTFKKMFDGWQQQKKSLMIDMKGEELQQYFKYLSSINVPFKGGLEQKRRLQYIAYFNKGFIGMASPDEQPEDTLLLLERFAGVFNLTFTRFNDLKVAEAHALQAEQDLIEIKAARKKAEEALTELQSTQKQLIQSEKMASLGELTAGIAHEIQNPLNFVNNFSEVSTELVDEMNEEITKGNLEDAKEIANDLKQNLEKINHHGKRAGDIVKGMLQHSRKSEGKKELTDINALCDEYLRLSYHGLRAKDKSFNAKFETDFDSSLPKINVVPQDIGRVVLNLINNAFYAASLPSKGGFLESESRKAPTVWVSTKKLQGQVEIKVRDNGPGIPKEILDKIFQPFFTTKPTGQGTGLGLSLSYDIIKAHGGEIKVETKVGEGSEFIVQLPVV